MRTLAIALLLLLFAAPALAVEYAVIETNLGEIRLELDEEKAPKAVRNFLLYADAGFYDGTIFHRVIKNFMIQGGGFDTDLKKKEPRSPIKNEADNGLKNDRGTIAMARTNVVDSATSQFFINLKNNDFLNHRDKSRQGYGYAVFGRVVEGMEVVDKIASTRTEKKGGPFQDLPKKMVIIEKVRWEKKK